MRIEALMKHFCKEKIGFSSWDLAKFDDQGTMMFFHCHQWETCHYGIQVSRCLLISDLGSQIKCCHRCAKVVSRRTLRNSPSTDSSTKQDVLENDSNFVSERTNFVCQEFLVFKQYSRLVYAIWLIFTAKPFFIYFWLFYFYFFLFIYFAFKNN